MRDRGEVVDEEGFERIVAAVNAAIAPGREQGLRYAQGDYRPDPEADRFLARKALAADAAEAAKPPDYYDLKAIDEKFATERKRSMGARKKWSVIIAEAARVYADIRQVSADWCIEWKDQLLARGLTARSIQYDYLAALRSTCAWAVMNKRISVNPVDGISVKAGSHRMWRC